MKNEKTKSRTPQQALRRKKMIVMPLFFLAFAGIMWLIFSTHGSGLEQLKGLNTDLPTPAADEIVTDKRAAYTQAAQHERDRRKSVALDNVLFGEPEDGDPEVYARQAAMAPKPVYEEPLGASAQAYSDLNRQLSDFHSAPEPAVSPDAAQARIEELERKLAARNEEEEQLRLIEKSYQIASKYTGGTVSEVSVETFSGDKPIVQPVAAAHQEVVSRLGGRSGSFEGGATCGFFDGVSSCSVNGSAPVQNTISAVIYGDQTVCAGQGVRLRTVEAMRIGAVVVPAGTVVTGLCSVTGERLGVVVSSIEHNGTILSVDISVYDLDGLCGLRAPGSMELDAAKEIIGGMGQSAGTTISLGGRQSAAGQLLADIGRGVMQGTSQYVGKKARQIKVTLRDGYKLFLLPKNN